MDYDVVVIGGGPAGYSLALSCQSNGLNSLLIEKEPHLGGVCLHMGCIPSKTLLHATEHTTVTPHALMQKKEKVVNTLSQGLDTLFSVKKINRLTAHASVVNPHTVKVLHEGHEKIISAKNIVLATGSQPIELPFLPFDEVQVVSSTGALNIEHIPESLVVIGAGVIGVELASVYRRLGSQVTIIELLPSLCYGFDTAIRAGLQKSLQAQGIEFHFDMKVTGVEKKKNRLLLEAESNNTKSTFSADRVLVAIGRRPNSQGLGLEELGIKILDSGHVKVDSAYRTNIPSIFAIGDLTVGPMLAHRASAEAEALSLFLAGKQAEVDMVAIPNVIYTSPEVASCGFTEEECKGKMEINTGTYMLKNNGRAVASDEIDGFVKVIGEKSTNRLLGVHILSHHASEMIAVASLALHLKVTVAELAHLPFPHPTLSEAVKEAAMKCG